MDSTSKPGVAEELLVLGGEHGQRGPPADLVARHPVVVHLGGQAPLRHPVLQHEARGEWGQPAKRQDEEQRQDDEDTDGTQAKAQQAARE